MIIPVSKRGHKKERKSTREFSSFASLEKFMPKPLDKDAVKILKLSWRIRNALSVRVVVLQTKYCISNKFLINLESMSKTFTVNKRWEFCIDSRLSLAAKSLRCCSEDCVCVSSV